MRRGASNGCGSAAAGPSDRATASPSRRWPLIEHEAESADRADELGLEVPIDPGSKSVDVDVDEVRLSFEPVAPDLVQDHPARHHLSAVAKQVLEDGELLAGKVDSLTAALNPAPGRIEDEVGDPENFLLAWPRRAPLDHPNPRDQLRECEGFREVIVGPELEPPNPITRISPGRQEEHRRLDPCRAEIPQQLEAALVGEHHV